MAYDPKIHHRRSIRLKGYDYTRPGDYFITICTHQQKYRFGRIVNATSEDITTPDGRHIRFSPSGDFDAIVFASAEMRDSKKEGNNIKARMELNALGRIAYDEWLKLP